MSEKKRTIDAAIVVDGASDTTSTASPRHPLPQSQSLTVGSRKQAANTTQASSILKGGPFARTGVLRNSNNHSVMTQKSRHVPNDPATHKLSSAAYKPFLMFQDRLGIRCESRRIFLQALTYSTPYTRTVNMEALSELGLPLLRMLFLIYLRFYNPGAGGGKTEQLVNKVLDKECLIRACGRMDIDTMILYLMPELEGDAQRHKKFNFVFAALCAAVYLDSGFENAFMFVKKWLLPQMASFD